ncbi:complement factor H-like isoform X2 [Lytechinus variegatus]|uniref:complement factor H-like isoform X2 n=1 Tax=Lytechinus variegatus TaxID=7654 RepID=UPI001BB12035|nr:complement factor H-like isoform X2 [Lytechinus variegatus]
MSLWDSKLTQTTTVVILFISGTLCSPPDVSGAGTVTFSPNQTCYDEGSSVKVTCSGYLFGVTEIGECFDGYWETPQQPTCEESNCPVPTAPQKGSHSPTDSNNLYDEIEYSCDGGLFLDGPSMAVCTGTGQWSPNTIPSCSGNCTIPIITNGECTSSDGILKEGSQLTITCAEGYSLIGVANVTCHNEEWNPEVGECLANCPSPGVENSDFATNQEETNHGDYIILTCDEGFTSGSGENLSEPLTCVDGTWDKDLYCFENCPKISPPDGGNMYPGSASFYHSNSVYFNCSENYLFVGQSNLTCDNGTWSDSVPDCKVPGPDALMITVITCTVAVILLVVCVIMVLIYKRSRQKRANNSSSPADAFTTFRRSTDTLPTSPPENFANQQDDHDFAIGTPTPGGTVFYENPDSIQPSIYQTINNEVVEGGYELMIYRGILGVLFDN